MTTTTPAVPTVKKTVTVNATAEHAFAVFTSGFDTWWPRTHHVGKKPLQTAVIEPRVGGRCFGREADGTECRWATVTAWEPPRRLVLAWQLGPAFQFDPDLAHASEVEVLFSPAADGKTRVDLEHRHFERHGQDADKLSGAVGGTGGWGTLLQIFGRTAATYHPGVKPSAFILAANDAVADRAFAGVKPEDHWTQPTPNTNSMLWVYAHMAAVRARLLNALGDDFDPKLGDRFGRGAALQDPGTYPTRAAIVEASHTVNARLFTRLSELTDADLARPAKGPLPPAVQTLGDQIAFIALHDAYHVGQLGYARKALGYPGVVG